MMVVFKIGQNRLEFLFMLVLFISVYLSYHNVCQSSFMCAVLYSILEDGHDMLVREAGWLPVHDVLLLLK